MSLIEEADRIMDPVERERHLQGLMARMRELAPALLLTTASQRVATSPDIAHLALNPPNIAYDSIRFLP